MKIRKSIILLTLFMIFSVNQMKAFASDYLLPQSSSEYLDESDIVGFTQQELNYAKNEIFARHGRKFASQELREYFNSMDWYVGNIEPEEFDDSSLNDYERVNAEFLRSKEFANDPDGYELDAVGYDIYAVRMMDDKNICYVNEHTENEIDGFGSFIWGTSANHIAYVFELSNIKFAYATVFLRGAVNACEGIDTISIDSQVIFNGYPMGEEFYFDEDGLLVGGRYGRYHAINSEMDKQIYNELYDLYGSPQLTMKFSEEKSEYTLHMWVDRESRYVFYLQEYADQVGDHIYYSNGEGNTVDQDFRNMLEGVYGIDLSTVLPELP